MTNTHEYIVDAAASDADVVSERALRPTRLDDYVGQPEMRDSVRVMIAAARARNEPLDHILLYGPPGLGKTTMAGVIATELGVRLLHASGPSIERAGDLVSMLIGLEPRDVLFIDEIHRLRPELEELLYSALEDDVVDIVSGAGRSARAVRLTLAPFTCIGATTRAGSLTGPLRDRFGALFRLKFYNDADLSAIIRRSASLLGVEIDEDAVGLLSRSSRGTPRIANRLLRRARDEAQVEDMNRIDLTIARRTLARLRIDDRGLDAADRDYLRVLATTFAGGPAGVAALAASLSEDIATLEDVVEPFLLRLGLVARTTRGRMLTPDGVHYAAQL